MYVTLMASATVVGDNTQQRPGLRGRPAKAGEPEKVIPSFWKFAFLSVLFCYNHRLLFQIQLLFMRFSFVTAFILSAFTSVAQSKAIISGTILNSRSDSVTIIYGESGSGKEVIAQEIHKRSRRSNKPFIAIDCGTLSRELAGSELFGHEKGSFTGAIGQKTGSFELANGGTIFLDEISNLPYDVQVTLLRVTQERKMRRVGGIKDIDLVKYILKIGAVVENVGARFCYQGGEAGSCKRQAICRIGLLHFRRQPRF